MDMSVFCVPDKFGTNSPTQKGLKERLAWREIQIRSPESSACNSSIFSGCATMRPIMAFLSGHMVLQDLLSYVPYFWRMHRELGEEEQGGRQQVRDFSLSLVACFHFVSVTFATVFALSYRIQCTSDVYFTDGGVLRVRQNTKRSRTTTSASAANSEILRSQCELILALIAFEMKYSLCIFQRRDATFLRQCMWRKACTNLSPSVQ